MSGDILLTGPLARPEMLDVLDLRGTPAELPCALAGGARAGLSRAGWPVLIPGQAEAMRVVESPRLRRYAEIFGLTPQVCQGQTLLGAGGPEQEPGHEDPWNPAAWSAQTGELAAEIAREVLSLPSDLAADRIAARLPMIGVQAQSRLHAQSAVVENRLLPPADPGRVEVLARRQPYAGFFSVEELDLRHRLNDGGWSGEMTRAVWNSGDATVVLPWDPARDRVLLIDQFRPGPLFRGDPQSWLLETIAGRIDAGETPEQAARREALEEAGLPLGDLIAGPAHYPSPGTFCEFLYLFVGIADLPDGIGGVGGIESEQEDIRSHVVLRSELMQMVRAGQIVNGPLLVMALWLDAEAGRLRDRYRGALAEI